jgi:hypothetical protein
MKFWMFTTAIMVLQIGAGVVFIKDGNIKLGVFYITCACSNAALTFIP